MARSTETIYQSISTEAAAYPELSDLEAGTSLMHFWHYAKRVFAFGAYQLEVIFDQLKAEILLALKLDYTVGTVDWYKSVLREFQLGDELKLRYNIPYYETIDPTKQIIHKISIHDISTGGLSVNVQKQSNGDIVPLSANELAAFSLYANRRKIAGTLLVIQSPVANILTLNAKVYLSRFVFDSTGKNLLTGNYDVLNALRVYVQQNDFDEVMYLSSLSDSMHDMEGVKAFHLTACTIDGVTVNLINGKLTLANGYGKINETDTQFNARMSYELI